MLQEGEIVEIDEKQYKVTAKEPHDLSCKDCDLRNCQHSKGYNALKAKHFALSCVDLIPLYTCFKEIVESSPQVDDKC